MTAEVIVAPRTLAECEAVIEHNHRRRLYNPFAVDGFVYFAQVRHPDVRGCPIKIGWAANPQSRIYELQSGCPWPLVVVGTERGRIQREREVHRQFAAERMRGEWFRASRRLIDYIGSLS